MMQGGGKKIEMKKQNIVRAKKRTLL